MARKRTVGDPTGYTILVVDDQEETLASVQRLLEREGHHVLLAESGQRALELFAQHEMLMAAFPEPQPRAEDVPIHNGCGCTLLELGQGQCRWPISNPGAEDFCFCGNEPVKGLPYCLGHARIAYRPAGRQRSSAAALTKSS